MTLKGVLASLFFFVFFYRRVHLKNRQLQGQMYTREAKEIDGARGGRQVEPTMSLRVMQCVLVFMFRNENISFHLSLRVVSASYIKYTTSLF